MRTIEKHVVSGLVGLACAFLAAWAFSPERHLPAGKLVLLVGDWCPKSLDLQRQVAEDPELGDRILTMTTEGELQECDRAVDDVLEEAPWLGLFDRAWICHRLNRHAAALFHEHFVSLPAWLENGAPVPPSESHAALERHGLTSCPGPVLHVGEASCATQTGLAQESGGVVVDAVERGWDIGL